jgi:putative peptidoglycan lipid II flippase
VLAAGFDAERAELTTRLIRVLFPMAGLMVLSGWCLGIQNSHRRFFLSYASAAMWSVAQIVLLAGWGARSRAR